MSFNRSGYMYLTKHSLEWLHTTDGHIESSGIVVGYAVWTIVHGVNLRTVTCIVILLHP